MDRILEIADLLMGAANADQEVRSEEVAAVRGLLRELLEVDQLPPDLEARVTGFSAAKLDVARLAARFIGDPPAQKRKLLELVVAVRDADDVIDLDEDAYLRDLARALGVPHADIADLVLEHEVGDLRAYLASLRIPPPIPK